MRKRQPRFTPAPTCVWRSARSVPARCTSGRLTPPSTPKNAPACSANGRYCSFAAKPSNDTSARRDLALRDLADRKVAVAEVAYLLGDSEPSAFHRAFERWTGTTPCEARLRTAVC
jgi:hypothetical protein